MLEYCIVGIGISSVIYQDGGNNSFTVVDLLYDFSGLWEFIYIDKLVMDTVTIEKGFGSAAIRAPVGTVHNNLVFNFFAHSTNIKD